MEAWKLQSKTVVNCPQCGSDYIGSLDGFIAPNGNSIPDRFGCGKCGNVFPKPDDPLLCPTCKRVLDYWHDLDNDYPYFCDACNECYSAALEKEPAAPKEVPAPQPLTMPAPAKTCKFCKHLLEFDNTVRDQYQWWCAGCNACFDDAGKPQPGQYIYMRVPDEEPVEPAVTPERIAQLEAVAAAAVAVHTRNGKDLVYMPGSGTRDALTKAVTALISSGWRPK